MSHNSINKLYTKNKDSSCEVLYVTDATFETEVLKCTMPVLVDFTATLCEPCQLMGPILEQVAKDYCGRVKVVKLDVDSNPTTTASYGVKGLPLLMLIKDGEVLDRNVGTLTKAKLSQFIKATLV